jgi:lipoprotein-anchoring transpeptidase ErfK/SrfK
MLRSSVSLLSCTAVGLLLLGSGVGRAQYYEPYPGYPPPRERSYDDQRGAYGRPVDEDDFQPSARPRPRAQDDDFYDDPSVAPPARPRVNRRVASLPPDADPNYSTPMDFDAEVDFSQTTAATVDDPTAERSATITIDTRQRKLYFSLGDGRAIEYGIGVGREGFAWKGLAQIGRKAFWPGWTPPREMLLRRPDLPRHMDGGMDNPLGARALYLFKGAKDTMFRIHGTNEPDTIGQAVSSGCIRMLNADVIDLYRRAKKGMRVVVL